MRERWPVKEMNNWLAYSKAIGGLTPLTAEQFCYGIWIIAQTMGAKIRFEEIYLPEVGREKSVDEITAIFGKWARQPNGSNNPRPSDQD